MSEASLKREIERQARQIELLEQMIEDRARALVDASRRAGMADVATSVLHNVGNALNSVNVSANVIAGLAKASKAAGVAKAAALLRAQADPGRFLLEDPHGKKLLDYLEGVGAALEADREKSLEEVTVLEKSIEHIKAIVMTQQRHARSGQAIERIALRAVIADAVRMTASANVATSVVFEGFDGGDAMTVDRHKLFQILMNLLTNAAHAVKPRSAEKRVDVRVTETADDRICIAVTDNGVGIPAENLAKIFAHGFTTKSTGHGFGLHSCANAASEIGGKLVAASNGPGLGATFALTLPRNAATSLREAV